MAFYKLENTELLEAPNFVILPDGLELFADRKDEYTYPVNDWYWFDSLEQAKTFFNIQDEQ